MASVAPDSGTLFIPNKDYPDFPQPRYGVDMRTIERWANSQPKGGVQQLIAGTNITLDPTDGKGVVTINSTGGGGFVPYASLLGAGEFSTPGALTQSGDFTVDGGFTVSDSGGTGVTIGTAAAVNIGATGNVSIAAGGGAGGVMIDGFGSNGITITEHNALGAITIFGTAAGITIGSGIGLLSLGGGHIDLASGGFIDLRATAVGEGISWETQQNLLGSAAMNFFTADIGPRLSTPSFSVGSHAFGFTQDGHIYYWNSGWVLVI